MQIYPTHSHSHLLKYQHLERQASFQVRGSFRNDLFAKIESEIKNTLHKSANQASDALGSAQKSVEDQKAKFNSANDALQSAKE